MSFDAGFEGISCVDCFSGALTAGDGIGSPVCEEAVGGKCVVVGEEGDGGFDLFDPSAWFEIVVGLFIDEAPLLI